MNQPPVVTVTASGRVVTVAAGVVVSVTPPTCTVTVTPPSSQRIVTVCKQGPAGTSAKVLYVRQALIGTIDGANKVFSTAQAFTRASPFQEAVYRRGLRLTPGAGNDYVASESGGAGTGYDTITYTEAPKSGDVHHIDFYLFP